MTPLASTRNRLDPTSTGAGLLPRLRAWVAAVCMAGASSRDVAALKVVGSNTIPGAVLLPFPIRGEALLVKLAELLRRRVADRASWRNRFVLTITRGLRSRLIVDSSSYIEFHPDRFAYHMVVEADSDTTIAMDTTDFDTLVQFVVQYINGRLSETTALEVAS